MSRITIRAELELVADALFAEWRGDEVSRVAEAVREHLEGESIYLDSRTLHAGRRLVVDEAELRYTRIERIEK